MKLLRTTYLLATFFLIGGMTPSFSQSPEQLFQKGLIKEDGEGNLNEAISLYNEIVENQDADKSLRAKALLHVGRCYEKLGRDEATKAYQQLVNNFPGQESEVAIARARLSLLLVAEKVMDTPPAMINKKIWEAQDIDDSGEISPDGKYLSFTDWNTGDLTVYETASGKKRKLTNINQGSNYDQFAFSSKWSPDGSRIYYSYFVSPELSEIRSIGLTDSQAQSICKIEGQEIWLHIRDVSGDGTSILATIENPQSTQFIIASISKGSYRIIKELPYVYANHHPIFTNDDTGIIYDYPQKQGSSSHDINLLEINEKKESTLISHPANDIVLSLTPDGKQLLFASSRSGQAAFWTIDFKNGKTIGNPTLIKMSEYRNLSGLGFSENGAFYYCYFPSKTDIYETEINPVKGEIVTPPHEVVGNFIGANSTPDYSSDGKYLAFVSRRAPYTDRETGRPIGNILCIKSLKDGNLREIRPEIPNFGFAKWSPDNRSILVVFWDSNYKMGLHKIDVETGETSLVDIGENKKFYHHEWSMDGKSVFILCEDGSGKPELVSHHMETGKETILIEGTWKDLFNFSLSPDGEWISFMGRDKNRSLKVIPAKGGGIREIHNWKQGDNRFITHCWSSDGKYIYLQKLREPKKDLIWNLWQIPVNGDNPVNLGLEMTDIWQISAHPDGRRLVYSNQGSSYRLPQVWLMENFLPKEETNNK